MAILGIDEVGRGPWAGPLVIGAVILDDPSAEWCQNLTDSKKLTKKRRDEYAAEILAHAPATALGWVSSRELDALGLTKALRLATRRAVTEVQRQKVAFSEIIIDGPINFLAGTPLARFVTNLNKADLLIKEVSAASILAKVARDEYMTRLAEIYPDYGFERHMGYGTALHRTKLAEFGPCPEHRTLVKPIQKLKPATKISGDRAESVVADYLKNQGHYILSRNHKTKFYEIDIISTKGDHIYFTEVKYRQNSTHGSPLTAIDRQKLQQMHFAAESFLKYQPQLKSLSPILAAAAVSGPDFHLDTWFPITE